MSDKLESDSPSNAVSCSLPVEGMKVIPYGWGDPFLSGAFMECAKWAASEKEVMDTFESETGKSLNRLVGRSPITIMVDDATGFSRDLVASWFDWVALNVWGEEENETSQEAGTTEN